jgi:GNAT superfamily N-acetyltransferase
MTIEYRSARLPDYQIRVYRDGDLLPAEAEVLFWEQLAEARCRPPNSRSDTAEWHFALTCAVTITGHVLGGVHLEVGPIGGSGPLAHERLAYMERTLVRPEYRRRGVATQLLRAAIQAAREAGCLYLRCSNNWDNEAERRLFRKCGFALVDLNDEVDDEPCYMAVRPLQGLDEGPSSSHHSGQTVAGEGCHAPAWSIHGATRR